MTDRPELVFTDAFGREGRAPVDRQKVTHRAMAWAMDYTPEQLLTWIGFYERKAERSGMPPSKVDVEILHKARDLLASEQGGPERRLKMALQ